MDTTGKSAARQAAERLREALDGRYQGKQYHTQATITAVARDSAGRAVSATAIVDGVAAQSVAISAGASIAPGDTWIVRNAGGASLPRWEAARRLRAAVEVQAPDALPTLPTPAGLAVLSDLYRTAAGGEWRAYLRCSWLGIGAQYRVMGYDVQYMSGSPETLTVITATDRHPVTLLDGAIDDTQTVIPRDPDEAGYQDDFPSFGRIQIESERIDYLAVTAGEGDSGTGTGAANSFTDGTKSWDADQWADYALTDSAGDVFLVTANTGTVLTVAGTPASGAYTIKPAFSGCTRAAGGTAAAAHDDDTGVGSLSVGITIPELPPDTDYNVRVRAHSAFGGLSAWTAWVSIQTELDVTPPPAPWGFAVVDAVGGVSVTWTGPTRATTPDLAGFELYKAVNSAGLDAEMVQVTGAELGTFYEGQEYGERAYFNLKAFDTAGNRSDWAVATWLSGEKFPGQGEQLLPNADFERDFDAYAMPDGFNYLFASVGGGGTTTVTLGAYGRNGGRGLRLTIPYINTIGNDVQILLYWPDPIYSRLIPVDVGQYYTASIHFKTNQEIGAVRFNADDALEDDGYLYVAVMPIFHSGSVYDPITAPGSLPAATYLLQQLADDWYRISCTYLATDDDVAGGKDYIGWAVYIRNGTIASAILDLDQAMLEMSRAPSEWAPSLRAVADGGVQTGLLIDTSGIVSANRAYRLRPDGKVSIGTENEAWSLEVGAQNLAVGEGDTFNAARVTMETVHVEDVTAFGDLEALYVRYDLTADYDVGASYVCALHGDLWLHGTGTMGPQLMAGVYGTVTAHTDFTGSADCLMGVRGEVTVEDGANMRLAALYAAWPEINGGTILGNYGIYIEDVTADPDYAGTPGADFQLYSAGVDVPSYFAGRVGIGEVPTWMLQVGKIEAPGSGDVDNLSSFHFQTGAMDAALDGNDIEAVYSRVTYENAQDLVNGRLVAVHGDLLLSGAGDIGPQVIAGVWGGGTYSGTGTPDTLVGVLGDFVVADGTDAQVASLYAAAPTVAAGTTLNAYGLYIGDMDTLATNNWAIYAVRGNCHLGGFVELPEIAAAPAAPAADHARLFVQDNGAGKTQLCVRFSTGAVQVLVTEP